MRNPWLHCYQILKNQALLFIRKTISKPALLLIIVTFLVMPISNLGKRWGLPVAGKAASEPKGKRKHGGNVSSIKPSKQRKKRRTGNAGDVSAAAAAPVASAASGAHSSASASVGLAAETTAQHLQRHCRKDCHLRCARCKWLGSVASGSLQDCMTWNHNKVITSMYRTRR